ncbi:MAG TPA: glucose 1-dehydrogenase [Puia sp.]|jgi:3-oxoacyl-[acyl-carrier protein] reductase
MAKKLENRVALVTGASKGIGAGIAKELAAEGASVVVNYASDREGAEKTVETITKAGGKAIAVKANVASKDEVARMFEQAKKTFGKLDILVNNAGIFGFTPIETITDDIFYKYYNVNVLGAIHCIQESITLFGEGGGTIINIGSTVVTMDVPGSLVYTSSKYVYDSMTRMLAKELAPKKIRVNSVNAGSTETEGTVAAGLTTGDAGNFFLSQTPMGRIGKPEDIAKVVSFLASDDARWVTGELVTAAGGLR